MRYTNNIYLNGEKINTITTEKAEEIIKELINCYYFYGVKPIKHDEKILIVRYAFTRYTHDKKQLNYVYNIVFDFNGLAGVNL